MTPAERLFAAVRHAEQELDGIATLASCAPNDDAEAAGRELTKIMQRAFQLRNELRAAMAEAGGSP